MKDKFDIKLITHLVFTLFVFGLFACNPGNEKTDAKVDNSLNKIRSAKKLTAITGYNAYSYFIYRGQPMGYEYELLTRLGSYLGVDVEIKVAKSLDSMFVLLNNGQGDLIAHNLTVTNERKNNFMFTDHHFTTQQVLVQRKPDNWRKMKLHVIEQGLIRNVIDLDGDTIYVRANSSHAERLNNLSNEIGGPIHIVEVDGDISQEKLMKMVNDKEINYTVADIEIARLMAHRYPSLDIITKISFKQKVAWALKKGDDSLAVIINSWLAEMKKDPDYYELFRKYYLNKYAYKRRTKSEYFSMDGGKVSKYDDLVKEYAKQLEWDWRLLAALIYKESQFNPSAESWAGAKGLMQMMPATAKQFGVKDRGNAHQSVKAGVKYLKYLDKMWRNVIIDENERIKFILASYNIGPGHIQDAVELAPKQGLDANVWFENVENALLSKSRPEVYNDPVVKFGYCSGKETVNYVEEVLNIYSHYTQFIPEDLEQQSN